MRLGRSFLPALAAVAVLAVGACNSPNPNTGGAPTCVPIAAGTGGAGTVGPSGAPAGSAAIDVSSPQGVIVYADGDPSKALGRLHVVWPDGSHAADLSSQFLSDFAVSPDGKAVELDTANGPELVGTDGSGERRLELGDVRATDFAWSRDGKWLAFHGQAGPASSPTFSLYQVDPSGCQPVAVSVKGSEHDTPIAVSPDGSAVLVYANTQQTGQKLDVASLYLDNPGAGTRTLVGQQGSTTLVTAGTGSPAAWSPDGKRLAFTAANVAAAEWSATANGLYLADADGSNVKSLVASGIVSGVAWSPDGQWLASTRIDPSGTPQVFIVKVDGSAGQVLTKFQSPGGCCPVWSPDGASVLSWGGTVIAVSGAGASSLAPVAGAGPYAYAWVKP